MVTRSLGFDHPTSFTTTVDAPGGRLLSASRPKHPVEKAK